MTPPRNSVIVAAVIATLLTGCVAGSSPGAGEPDPAGPAPTAAPPRCMPDVDAEEIFFEGADGIMLAGVEAGEGTLGVVLVHGSGRSGRCVWTNEIPALAAAGFHVLAIDHACEGVSECPDDKDKVADIAAAGEELRRRGAEVVAVIGGSAGTAETIVAGAQADIDAVVALSPTRFDVPVTLTAPETVEAAVAEMRVPTLLVVGTADRLASVDGTTALAQAFPLGLAELIVVAGGGHAQLLLYEGTTAGSGPGGPTYDAVIAFLNAHLAA